MSSQRYELQTYNGPAPGPSAYSYREERTVTSATKTSSRVEESTALYEHRGWAMNFCVLLTWLLLTVLAMVCVCVCVLTRLGCCLQWLTIDCLPWAMVGAHAMHAYAHARQVLLIAALARPEWVEGTSTTAQTSVSFEVGLFRQCTDCTGAACQPAGEQCDNHNLTDSDNELWVAAAIFFVLTYVCVPLDDPPP
jgi:hypothetical protein